MFISCLRNFLRIEVELLGRNTALETAGMFTEKQERGIFKFMSISLDAI